MRITKRGSAVALVLFVAHGCSSSEDTTDTAFVEPPALGVPVPGPPERVSSSDEPDASLGASGAGGAGGAGDAGDAMPLPSAGPPVETRPPHGSNQTPSFPEQTRAPSRKASVVFSTRVVASGLQNPWSIAFLPDGALLVTERPGRMRVVASDGTVSPALDGVPAVDARGQGGLLDVALDPAFATSGLVYFSFAEPRAGGNGTAVARARLVRQGAPRLVDVTTIWRQAPTIASTAHFGARIVPTADGHLFVTLGERGSQRQEARQLGSTLGKVVRVRADGAAAQGNPFAGRAGALAEIWSIGHRNVQAAALHPVTGELWIADHGARGGDEINVARAGRDYGWATVTYGIDYDGTPIGQGLTSSPGIEQPVYYWDPSIAPCGMAFYTSDRIPAWKGSLFVGALAGEHLVRLTLSGERVVGEERLLEHDGRVRDVRVGPDGTVFVANESRGQILELVPAP